MRILKQVKASQAFCTHDKIVSCPSFLLFSAVNTTFPSPYMLSYYKLQVQIYLLSISEAAASIHSVFIFTSDYTTALLAHIPNCRDIKTDKRFLLGNTFCFYVSMKSSRSWASPSLKTAILRSGLMMRLGNTFLLSIRNSNKFT